MPENVNTSSLAMSSIESANAANNDDSEIMIKVDHVSMSFNMASEQLNSLKEYAVALAKGKLFFEEFKALDDISFEVHKGDVFGIMGTNGSGKSTMLKIIAGVLEPTKGSCTVNGNIAPLIELGAGFDMDLSARENIFLNGALLGYSKQFIEDHFDEIVEFAEIEKFLDMPLKNYSSGMVARIAFAIATVIIPDILVVDEVLSVGDFMFQRKCEERITELIEQHGVTVLIVSHNNDQIARLCNKAIWIEKGHTRLIGDASLVAHVYGGLGGRIGSSESEKIVFNALKKCENMHNYESLYQVVNEENPFSVSSKLLLQRWNKTTTDTVVLAAIGTHINSIVANAFAATKNAPILPTNPDSLTDTTMSIIYKLHPKKIVVFNLGNYSEKMLKEISDFDWDTEILYFGKNSESPFDFSKAIYEYGAEHNLWNESLALVDPDDNLESLALSPLLYHDCCPVIITSGESKELDYIKEMIANGSVEVAYCTNGLSNLDFGSNNETKSVSFQGSSLYERCFNIFEFVDQRVRKAIEKEGQLCIAMLHMSQWPLLVSCGPYCAASGTGILLVDTTNLDSIADVLNYISLNSSRIDQVVFLGNEHGLQAEDFKLLSSALVVF